MRLIDADALKKSICEYASEPVKVNDRRWDTKCRAIILDVIGTIESAPTVEPKRGRWVKMTGMMPPEYHGHYECSECGWHMKGLRNTWTREEELTYCPNCGARMEGETDEK